MVTAGQSYQAVYRSVVQALVAAGCPDPAFDAAQLCLFVTGVNPMLTGSLLLSQAHAAQLTALANRRASREPLQYILGRWSFLNFEVAVGPGVLCPRADTELVTEFAAQALQGMQLATPQVLELCGGTGCIGLGIKMFYPNAQITVLEKSKQALAYLHKNAQEALRTQLPEVSPPYVRVVEGDLFDYHATLPAASVDLLVSNPPYLTQAEMQTLQPEVANEPAMALQAGQDGLVFYRAISKEYQRVVKPSGQLVLEIGYTQAQAVTDILIADGWCDVICKQDYSKNDRCILARRRGK